MRHLRSFTIIGCLLACSVPATSHAFGLSAGWTNWDNNLGDGANLQIYPQWEVGFGLSPELQVGVHWVKNSITGLTGSGTQHYMYIPAMAGLRWDLGKVLPLGILGPFIGGHLGYARFETFGDGPTDGTNNFAFNFAAGLNFDLGDTVAIGVQGGADILVGSESNQPQEHIYSLDVILTL